MLFSLEALRARHGDSLVLHFGTADQPRLVVIDGGPSGVFGDALKPRLGELRDRAQRLGQLTDDGALSVDLLMVSHIDDDHIQGVLDLTDELTSHDARGVAPWVKPKVFWHNSFGDLTQSDEGLLSLAGGAEVQALSEDPAIPAGVQQSAAVLASVSQGRRLRDDAEKLGWKVNAPFGGLVSPAEPAGAPVSLDDETSLLVLAPNQAQLEALREEWAKQLKKAQEKASGAELAAYLDKSPYNLSSIVCLAEQRGKRMLLTGDARGDFVLETLRGAGLLGDEPLHVDILKLPHHGSVRNVDEGFFAGITADHYIASGDGRHGNPDSETLELIAGSREDDDFTIHLTYASGVGDLGVRIERFRSAQAKAGRKFEIAAREDAALSLRVDLAGAVPD